jgi:hypothetical protein
MSREMLSSPRITKIFLTKMLEDTTVDTVVIGDMKEFFTYYVRRGRAEDDWNEQWALRQKEVDERFPRASYMPE